MAEQRKYTEELRAAVKMVLEIGSGTGRGTGSPVVTGSDCSVNRVSVLRYRSCRSHRLERHGCPRQVLGLSRSLVWTTVQIRMPAAPRRRPAAK